MEHNSDAEMDQKRMIHFDFIFLFILSVIEYLYLQSMMIYVIVKMDLMNLEHLPVGIHIFGA